MQVNIYKTGFLSTNTYVLSENGHNIIIDPAGKGLKLIEKIEGSLDAILLTHGHLDHIKAVDELYEHYKCNIYLRSEDFELVDTVSSKIYNSFMGLSASIKSPITPLEEREYEIGPFKFKVIYTSGHTEGSCIFVFDDMIFTGDTLFKASCGRTDLHGGDSRKLKNSLKVFREFDKDYIIYPGHEDSSTLSYELIHNPYL